jgi:hypothetical protein
MTTKRDKNGLLKEANTFNKMGISTDDSDESSTTDDRDIRETIPIVISITPEVFNTIEKDGNAWNINTIHNIIKDNNVETYNKIKDMDKVQVFNPKTDPSYNKYITTFIRKAEQNEGYKILQPSQKDIDNPFMYKDTYQIYLDNRGFKIIVSIWYGSRTRRE